MIMTDKIQTIESIGAKTEKPTTLGKVKNEGEFPFDNILKPGNIEEPLLKVSTKVNQLNMFQNRHRTNDGKKIPLKAKEILDTSKLKQKSTAEAAAKSDQDQTSVKSLKDDDQHQTSVKSLKNNDQDPASIKHLKNMDPERVSAKSLKHANQESDKTAQGDRTPARDIPVEKVVVRAKAPELSDSIEIPVPAAVAQGDSNPKDLKAIPELNASSGVPIGDGKVVKPEAVKSVKVPAQQNVKISADQNPVVRENQSKPKHTAETLVNASKVQETPAKDTHVSSGTNPAKVVEHEAQVAAPQKSPGNIAQETPPAAVAQPKIVKRSNQSPEPVGTDSEGKTQVLKNDVQARHPQPTAASSVEQPEIKAKQPESAPLPVRESQPVRKPESSPAPAENQRPVKSREAVPAEVKHLRNAVGENVRASSENQQELKQHERVTPQKDIKVQYPAEKPVEAIQRQENPVLAQRQEQQVAIPQPEKPATRQTSPEVIAATNKPNLMSKLTRKVAPEKTAELRTARSQTAQNKPQTPHLVEAAVSRTEQIKIPKAETIQEPGTPVIEQEASPSIESTTNRSIDTPVVAQATQPQNTQTRDKRPLVKTRVTASKRSSVAQHLNSRRSNQMKASYGTESAAENVHAESVENPSDVLKQQLRDRIEVLKKAQDSVAQPQEQQPVQNMHRGLSMRATPEMGPMQGNTSTIPHPRANAPLFARSFAAEMIDKIREMSFEKTADGIANKASFVVDGGPMGEMDIEFHQEATREQITIFVENDLAKSELQRVMPHIEDNMNQRGLNFSNVDVEVKDNHKNSESMGDENSQHSDSNEKAAPPEQMVTEDNQANTNRNYGYNTMEVLA